MTVPETLKVCALKAWAWLGRSWKTVGLVTFGVIAALVAFRRRHKAVTLSGAALADVAKSRVAIQVFEEQRARLQEQDSELARQDAHIAEEVVQLNSAIVQHKRKVLTIVQGSDAWRAMTDDEVEARFRKAGL